MIRYLWCSVDKRVSQILNGHTGTFAKIKIPGRVEEAQVNQRLEHQDIFSLEPRREELSPVLCWT